MIIVDGYNVIYKWKSLSRLVYNIELARTRLAGILSNYQGYTGEEIVIVFDSSVRKCAQYENLPQNIMVVYAPSNQGADIFIEMMVNSCARPEDITVVTGDVLERRATSGSGAKTKTPEQFEEEVIKVCKREAI